MVATGWNILSAAALRAPPPLDLSHRGSLRAPIAWLWLDLTDLTDLNLNLDFISLTHPILPSTTLAKFPSQRSRLSRYLGNLQLCLALRLHSRCITEPPRPSCLCPWNLLPSSSTPFLPLSLSCGRRCLLFAGLNLIHHLSHHPRSIAHANATCPTFNFAIQSPGDTQPRFPPFTA